MERTGFTCRESITPDTSTYDNASHEAQTDHYQLHHHHTDHQHHHYYHQPQERVQTHKCFTNHYVHHIHHHHLHLQQNPHRDKQHQEPTHIKDTPCHQSTLLKRPKLSVSSRFLRLGRKLLLFLFLVCSFTCVALYTIISTSCCTVLSLSDGTTSLQLRGPAIPNAGRYVVATATGKRGNENRHPNHVFPLSSSAQWILPEKGQNSRESHSRSVGFGVSKKTRKRYSDVSRGDLAATSLSKSPFRFATAPGKIRRSGGRRGGIKGQKAIVGTGSDVAAAVANSHAYRGRISNDVGHTKGARGRTTIFVNEEGDTAEGKSRKSKGKKTYANENKAFRVKPRRKRKSNPHKSKGIEDHEDVLRSPSVSLSSELIGNAHNDHEALLSSSASSSLFTSDEISKTFTPARKNEGRFATYANGSQTPDSTKIEDITEYYSPEESNEEGYDDDIGMYDNEDYEGEDFPSTDDQVLYTSNAKYQSASFAGNKFDVDVNGSDTNFIPGSKRLGDTVDGKIVNNNWITNVEDNTTQGEGSVIPGRPVSIQRIRLNATKKLPQAIIIGVKKCGTRALLEYLRLHPDIKGTGPEPHFFDRHYYRGLEWYRNEMPPTIDGQMTIEKTPSYFITKEAPKRIFNMSKSMKILVIVRDPITRAISDYAQLASKRINMQRFEDLAFVNTTTRIVDTTWNVIRIGVYAKYLERWLHFFPLNQMHFVSGEELISDPAKELGRVQDFLGLKRIISDKHFYFNETKGFPCLKKTEGSGHPHCLGRTKGRPHPTVDSTVLKRLRDFYRPFNAKFYHMVQRNFNWP